MYAARVSNPEQDTRTRKLRSTLMALVYGWALLWTMAYGYLVSEGPGNGPGDVQSWAMVFLLAWGPVIVMEFGGAWLRWYRAPE